MKPISEFHKHTTNKDGIRDECKMCHRERQKERYNPEKYREYSLLKNYGITIEYYNDMFISQYGCCAICNKHQSEIGETLCVDHNHKTGKVRGLLCKGCNSQLAVYENGKELFEKYLNQYESV